jgi:hypothetical protein
MTGATCFLTIVDDYSRFVWTIFLKTRGEAGQKLLDFVNLVENQLGFKVQ